MKRLHRFALTLLITILLPLYAMATAEVRNLSVSGNCYSPGQYLTVSFELKADPNRRVFGDILFSTDANPLWTDMCVWNAGSALDPPDANGHEANIIGQEMYFNDTASTVWQSLSYVVKAPATLSGSNYIIVDVSDNNISLAQYYTHYENTISISLNECSGGTDTPTNTPTDTPTQTFTETNTGTPTDTATAVVTGCVQFDTSFGSNGRVLYNNTSEYPFGMVRDSTGRLVVVGYMSNGTNMDLAVL